MKKAKQTTQKISGLPSAGTREGLSFGAALRGASLGARRSSQPWEATTVPLDVVRRHYAPPLTLGAPKEVQMALDSALAQEGCYTLLQHTIAMGAYGVMPSFMGYGALQNIAQNGLIRACIETVSDDMTRNWVELSIADSDGGDDAPEEEVADNDANGNGVDDKIDAVKAEMERLDLRSVFHKAACLTGYYGGCLLYIEPKVPADPLTPLVPAQYSSEAQDGTAWIKSIKVIDPINVFPGMYNSSDPLADDFYKPQTWWILGKQVHASRLIRIVAHEPPQLLLPAYNFLGIPQAQILWDYVAHFMQNRDACNRLYNKQSMLLFKTDLANLLSGGGEAMSGLDDRMLLLAFCQQLCPSEGV